ncbi:MAG: hypothetical protein ACE5GF_09500, partial [Thermodesulfobacteriota bacterium]
VFDDLNTFESIRVFEKGISYDRDVDSYGEFRYLMRDGDIISPKIVQREPLKNLCNHFLNCIREGKAPLTGGRQGTNVVKVLIAIDESMNKRGAVVEIR